MITRYSPRRLTAVVLFVAIALIDAYAMAKGPPPMGPPGSGGGGSDMPWQVAATFTANWVLVAAGVAILSRPAKRPDKPKKALLDDEE